MNPAKHESAAEAAGDAFSWTFVWTLALAALCLIPAFLIPGRRVLEQGGFTTDDP